MIIENFIESFDELKRASLEHEFKDEVNPVDGVAYPLICKVIPKAVEAEILVKLSLNLGWPLTDHTLFMRKSPEGVDCPHQAHSDASMGLYSLMLYVNGIGGTSLLKHRKTGIAYAPESEEFVKIIQKDQNESDAWEITDMIDMKPNKAFIFDSRRLHRAEPVGGQGTGKDSRVVLWCLFAWL